MAPYQEQMRAYLPLITEGEFQRGVHRGWPVRDEADLAALEAVAALFGAEIQWNPLDTRRDRISPRGTVLTTRAAELDASLYASLTNRRLVRWADQDTLARLQPSVIIGERTFFETRALTTLVTRPPGAPVSGLIWGEPGADLRRQVLARSAARHLSQHPGIGRMLEIYPTESLGWSVFGNWAIGGASVDPKELRDVLSDQGNAAVAVQSHSDGVDALIHPQLTLCPVTGAMRPPTGEMIPYCMHTGQCFRHALDVDGMVRSPHRLSPNEIACRILVLAICHGVMPDDTVVGRPWRLADQIMAGFNVGALVTTVSVVIPPYHIIGELLRELATGVPLGRAVQRIHRRAPVRATNFRLLVIGDPDVRILGEPPSIVPQQRRPVRRTAPESLTFLRAYLTNALVRAPERYADLARKALEAVQLFEFSQWRGVSDCDEASGAGTVMRRTVLDYVEARGPVISHDWLELVKHTRVARPRRCWTCGVTLTVVRASFQMESIDRRLGICSRCGIVEDAPWSSRIAMRVTGSSVELFGAEMSARWAARLTVAPPDVAANTGIEWRRRADRRPARRMPLPAHIGYAKVSVVLIVGTSLTVLQAPGVFAVAGPPVGGSLAVRASDTPHVV